MRQRRRSLAAAAPGASAGTVLLVAALLAGCGARGAHSQQVADSLFQGRVGPPAYPVGRGPVVLLDEAHHNFHTADGRYLPFANLLRRDGYAVRPQRAPFTRAALDSAQVLVVANALDGTATRRTGSCRRPRRSRRRRSRPCGTGCATAAPCC